MQARNAERVLPEPVGAEISVVRPASISGQPCSWGSVGVPKRATNHSATSGCAHDNEAGISPTDIGLFYQMFAKCSPDIIRLSLFTFNFRRLAIAFRQKSEASAPRPFL